MASIQKTSKGYRVQTYHQGQRASRTFCDLAAAERWAASQDDKGKTIKLMSSEIATVEKDYADLVAIHRKLTIEKILRAAKPVGDVCGIYFLLYERKIVYIGQSNNCHKRIESHRNNKVFDSYTIVRCEPFQLDLLERVYIQRFEPPLNKTPLKQDIKSRYFKQAVAKRLSAR